MSNMIIDQMIDNEEKIINNVRLYLKKNPEQYTTESNNFVLNYLITNTTGNLKETFLKIQTNEGFKDIPKFESILRVRRSDPRYKALKTDTRTAMQETYKETYKELEESTEKEQMNNINTFDQNDKDFITGVSKATIINNNNNNNNDKDKKADDDERVYNIAEIPTIHKTKNDFIKNVGLINTIGVFKNFETKTFINKFGNNQAYLIMDIYDIRQEYSHHFIKCAIFEDVKNNVIIGEFEPNTTYKITNTFCSQYKETPQLNLTPKWSRDNKSSEIIKISSNTADTDPLVFD
jgi:hypothetical protein